MPLDRITYWVWGYTVGGNKFLYGAYPTEMEAIRQQNNIRDAIRVEVIPLRTSDKREAVRRIRALQVEETHSIDESLKRFRHNKEDING